jgi:hypothetical protein
MVAGVGSGMVEEEFIYSRYDLATTSALRLGRSPTKISSDISIASKKFAILLLFCWICQVLKHPFSYPVGRSTEQ